MALAIELPEFAEITGLLSPGFGGSVAVDGEEGVGRSSLISMLLASRKAVVARATVTRDTTLLEVLQEIILQLSRDALRLADRLPHPEQPEQGWQTRAKAQLFAPMYWTIKGLRALSVSLFSFIAIAFVIAQIAPDLFQRPLEALGGLALDLLAIPPLWVWPIVVVAILAIVLSLRLQKRLDRKVDEAVEDLSGWIPDERIRSWLGVDPESDADLLVNAARRLSDAVTTAQHVRGSSGSSNGLVARLGMIGWPGDNGDGEGARIGTITGAATELTALAARIAKLSRMIVVVEGPGAGAMTPDLAFVGNLPGADLVVEGPAPAADATVVIRPWPAGRLRELLLRRATGVGEATIAAAADGAKGNPRRAIRALRLAIATQGGDEPAPADAPSRAGAATTGVPSLAGDAP